MQISYKQADIELKSDVKALQMLIWEYLTWGNNLTKDEFGFDFDIKAIHDNFLEDLPLYTPPVGRIYLVKENDNIIGMGGYKYLDETNCELKRLFIKKEYRGHKIGFNLLHKLINDAKNDKYLKMKLESARIMKESFKLYQSMGFKEIDFYEGIESPKEYLSIIYCMELNL